MTTSNSLLALIDELLGKLIVVAEALKAESLQAVAHEVLEPLQEEQQNLVDEIVALDLQLQSKYGDGEVEKSFPKQWKAIQNKLQTFQGLNEAFINNLTVRKGLIDFELDDLKKQKGDLAQLKEVYVSTGKGAVRAAKGKGRINTVL